MNRRLKQIFGRMQPVRRSCFKAEQPMWTSEHGRNYCLYKMTLNDLSWCSSETDNNDDRTALLDRIETQWKKKCEEVLRDEDVEFEVVEPIRSSKAYDRIVEKHWNQGDFRAQYQQLIEKFETALKAKSARWALITPVALLSTLFLVLLVIVHQLGQARYHRTLENLAKALEVQEAQARANQSISDQLALRYNIYRQQGTTADAAAFFREIHDFMVRKGIGTFHENELSEEEAAWFRFFSGLKNPETRTDVQGRGFWIFKKPPYPKLTASTAPAIEEMETGRWAARDTPVFGFLEKQLKWKDVSESDFEKMKLLHLWASLTGIESLDMMARIDDSEITSRDQTILKKWVQKKCRPKELGDRFLDGLLKNRDKAILMGRIDMVNQCDNRRICPKIELCRGEASLQQKVACLIENLNNLENTDSLSIRYLKYRSAIFFLAERLKSGDSAAREHLHTLLTQPSANVSIDSMGTELTRPVDLDIFADFYEQECQFDIATLSQEANAMVNLTGMLVGFSYETFDIERYSTVINSFPDGLIFTGPSAREQVEDEANLVLAELFLEKGMEFLQKDDFRNAFKTYKKALEAEKQNGGTFRLAPEEKRSIQARLLFAALGIYDDRKAKTYDIRRQIIRAAAGLGGQDVKSQFRKEVRGALPELANWFDGWNDHYARLEVGDLNLDRAKLGSHATKIYGFVN